MKYFSMFSGIGGFELGIQRATLSVRNGQTEDTEPAAPEQGVESTAKSLQPNRNSSDTELRGNTGEVSCVGYSEIDKYAIKVYERHYGHVCDRAEPTKQGSRAKEGRTELHSEGGGERNEKSNCNCGGHTNYGDATNINTDTLPDFDLLVGGFPCQAFSVAGKRGGFNDTRGTLFFSIARVLAEKRPKHLLLENVKGLLSHDSGKTFQTILGVLSDLGYETEWQVLNSKDFGVPQNRERVFIVGHLGGDCGRKVFPIIGTDAEDTRIIGQDVAYTIDANYHKGTNTLEKSRRSIVQVNQPKHSNDRVYGEEGVSPTLNTMQGGMRQPKVAQAVLTPDRAEKRQNGRRFKENGEPSFTLTGQDKHGVMTESKIRRLTPRECERLQGFPDDWTKYGVGEEPISDTQRYKMCGNAVTVNVIEAIIRNFKCLPK